MVDWCGTGWTMPRPSHVTPARVVSWQTAHPSSRSAKASPSPPRPYAPKDRARAQGRATHRLRTRPWDSAGWQRHRKCASTVCTLSGNGCAAKHRPQGRRIHRWVHGRTPSTSPSWYVECLLTDLLHLLFGASAVGSGTLAVCIGVVAGCV